MGIGFLPGDKAHNLRVSIEYVHSVATGSNAHQVVGIFEVAHLGSRNMLDSNFPAVFAGNQLHGAIDNARITSFLEIEPPLVREAIMVLK